MKKKDDNQSPEPVEDVPAEAIKYEVGYKRPPKATRFKKGVSGNPSGRRAKPALRSKTMVEFMNEPVELTMGGKNTVVTREDAIKLVLMNLALGGDKQAAKFMLLQLEKDRPLGEEATRYLQTNSTIQVNLIESHHKLENNQTRNSDRNKEDEANKKK
jgi:hypothetical protein